MSLTITLSAGALVVIAIAVILFVVVTVVCHQAGMFDGGSGYLGGLDSLFVIIAYAVLWAVPSLLAWAAWATWFRGQAS